MSDVEKNKNGEIIYLPFLWKIPLHEDVNWQINHSSVVGNNIVDGDKVLILTIKNETTRYLTLISSETGDVLWKWNDWYIPEAEGFFGRYNVQKDNQLHWIEGTRHYWVDLTTGATVKRYRGENSCTYHMSTFEDSFYVLCSPKDTLQQYETKVVLRGDFYTEEPERILVPYFDLSHAIGNRIGQVTSVIPILQGQDTLLIVAYQEIFPDWNFQSYLGLYNASLKKWVYERVPICDIHRKGVLFQPLKQVDSTVVATVGNNIVCYNFYSGEKIWERTFPHDFSFSGFEVAEGILVGNCENEVLYGLDVRTGAQRWTAEGGGTSSKLENRIQEGVAYFGGGSSGFFHAVDIHSGKTLWKLDPYLYEDNNANWNWSVNVVPGKDGKKGKVIIQNALFAYCFEAAR